MYQNGMIIQYNQNLFPPYHILFLSQNLKHSIMALQDVNRQQVIVGEGTFTCLAHVAMAGPVVELVAAGTDDTQK